MPTLSSLDIKLKPMDSIHSIMEPYTPEDGRALDRTLEIRQSFGSSPIAGCHVNTDSQVTRERMSCDERGVTCVTPMLINGYIHLLR
ncbi:hypothetical protein CHS0354_034866 [Potamilus streckersoni]|uniref:Uncharacterized protein n=1 Tax=Potamilus streckersoni TaxID=2493646 RepID=A0AAE0VQG7_9BIVA|nr:hypothetical protein CHS0354_034866 [Potamilus streckersoni]